MVAQYYYDYTRSGKRKIYYKIENGDKIRITVKQLRMDGVNPNILKGGEIFEKNGKKVKYCKEITSDYKKIGENIKEDVKKRKPRNISTSYERKLPADIHKMILDNDYITFQKSIKLPFKELNGLKNIDQSPNTDFEKFLHDIISLIGVIRLTNKMTSNSVYYSDLEDFLSIIIGNSPDICRGYRNYYGYSSNDIKLFPEDMLKSFGSQELELYYLPTIPDNNNIKKLEEVNNRKYINLDNIGKIENLRSYNDGGIVEAKKCIEDKSKHDYLLLTLRFHIEPTDFSAKVHKFPKIKVHNDYMILKEGRVHTAILLIDLSSKNPDGKNTGYFMDIFGDTDANKIYAMSSFVDLSARSGLPLFLSIYSNDVIPDFILQDNKSFANIWNWFLLSTEILNPEVGRITILKMLLNMNKINRLRLIYQFMYYIYQSYGKELIKKYMLEGIEEESVRGISNEYITKIWKTTYDIKSKSD